MSSALADIELDLKTAILNSTILEVFCHAIHTCVLFNAMYHIAGNANRNRQQMIFAGIITCLWCSVTVIVVLHWMTLNVVFIPREVSINGDAEVLVYNVLYVLNIVLADLLVIWRCWILYGRNWILAGCLGLCVLAEIGAEALLLFSKTIPGALLYYLMTAFINSLCTSLVLFRVVRVNGVRASLKTYGGIIEILVESAFMYSGIYIALAVTSMATSGYESMYLNSLSYSVTGIAPTLIVARVMAGHARPDDSWTRTSLPALRSNARTMDQSIRFATMRCSTTHITNIELEAAAETTGFERD